MGQEYNLLCDFTEPEPEYVIKAGTYILKETPSTDYFFDFSGRSGIGLVENGVVTDGTFSSNGNSYCMLIYATADGGATYIMEYYTSSSHSNVYDTGDSAYEDTGYWADLNYRIVTFDHDVKLADFDATSLGFAVTVPAKNQYYWFVNNFTRDDYITIPAGVYLANETVTYTKEITINGVDYQAAVFGLDSLTTGEGSFYSGGQFYGLSFFASTSGVGEGFYVSADLSTATDVYGGTSWVSDTYRTITIYNDLILKPGIFGDIILFTAAEQYEAFMANYVYKEAIKTYTIKAGTYTAGDTLFSSNETSAVLATKYDGTTLYGAAGIFIPFESNSKTFTNIGMLATANDWAYSDLFGIAYYSNSTSSASTIIASRSEDKWVWTADAYKTINITADTILIPISSSLASNAFTLLPDIQYKFFTSNYLLADSTATGSTLVIAANSTEGKTLYYTTTAGSYSITITAAGVTLEEVLTFWFDEMPGTIDRAYGIYTGSGTEADPYKIYYDTKLTCNFGYSVEITNTDSMTINYTLADGTTGSSSDISIHLDNVYSLYLSKIYPNIATFNSGTYIGTGIIDDQYILTSDANISFTYNFVSEPVTTGNYLAFHSDDGEFGFGVRTFLESNANVFTLEYSTDALTWYRVTITWEYPATSELLISHNGNLYLRGIGNSYLAAESSSEAESQLGFFNNTFYNNSVDIKVYAYGYIEYLLDYETVANGSTLYYSTQSNSCFNALFSGWKSLVRAPSFYNNTNALPSYGCYYMYYKCISLQTLPALHHTELGDLCYRSMFDGCTNIKISETHDDTYINEYRIPSTGTISTSASDCTMGMFYNTGGTFTDNPELNTTYYTSNEVI